MIGAPRRHPAENPVRVCLLCICLSLPLWTPRAASGQASILTEHNDNARTGANLSETVLSASNVNMQRFGMLFKRVVDDQVYSQPLYVAGVTINGAQHNVVYITTVSNSVYAFDADDAAKKDPYWHVNFGKPASITDHHFDCTDITGNFGIVGTPVIDAQSGVLYVVTLTKLDKLHFVHHLHALDITTGRDLPNSPVVISTDGFAALFQNQRPALLLSNGVVYVGFASHCDDGRYHGFLFAFDAKSLKQLGLFNASPTGNGNSIWQSGNGPAADADGNIYVVTSNGKWDGQANFSESFLKLDSQLHLLDWFTPTNYRFLDKKDLDLNSSGPLLIPRTNIILDGGKQGILYSVDATHLGHLGDENAVQHFQATSAHLHSIVYWTSAKNGSMLYLWGQMDRLRSYKFDGERFETTPFQIRPEATEGHPGGMLSLSANGQRDGILWAAIQVSGDTKRESRPGVLHAYDADDLMHELWNSLENPQRDNCDNFSKMAPPTIANGKVYLASFGTNNSGTGELCAYGLLPTEPPAASATQR